MSELEVEYQASRDFLFESLKVLDLYTDGEHSPQKFSTSEWVELEHSPGVFMKNVSLIKPDSFVVSLVHGTKGASAEKHTVFDDLEIHCITGKVAINGLVFKARDTWFIPAATEYNFEYLDDTYLTCKFIPKNSNNFNMYGPLILKEETENKNYY